MAGAQHFLPAASAVELAPSCIGSSFPLDPASYTERGTLSQLRWVATARLKLGSPQPVRCRPVIACLLYWVRRAQGTLQTSEQVLAPSSQKQKTTKTPALRFASWNIRTMCPGLSVDLQLMDDSRKTAIINKELARQKIDVACLQETRLAGTPSVTWAPPRQARLRSMLRSAAGSPKQLLSWPNSASECGAMTC